MKRFLLLSLLSAAFCAFAGEEENQIIIGKTYTIHSEILNEDRGILVHLPDAYQTSEQAFPVLYLLDGNQHLHHTTGLIDFFVQQGSCPPMIVVGITNTDRTRDMTPTRGTVDFQGNPTEGMPTSGGADKFLQFIEKELFPHVEKTYRTQPYRVLAGHSFGGLAALHALFSQPQMFNAYIAVSPSVWWDKDLLVRNAEAYLKANPNSRKSLYMTIANEGGLMRTNFDTIVEMFKTKAPAGLTFGASVMEDETHGSVVLRSHYMGLKKIFEKWQMPDGAVQEGMEAVAAHHRQLVEHFGFEVPIPETIINRIGYNHLGRQEYDQAVAVFKKNADLYPKSANVYDSLGEAYENQGKMDLAAENYEQAYKHALQIKDANVQLFKANLDRAKDKLSKATHSDKSE